MGSNQKKLLGKIGGKGGKPVLQRNSEFRVPVKKILYWVKSNLAPTPQQTDNAMADGVINGKVQPKQTKAMEMRFHWLHD